MTYKGQAIERGGTSIVANPAAAVLWMHHQHLTPGSTILDYGAGKQPGRNAEWLRAHGHQVYAYDPYCGGDVDGWESVSNQLPSQHYEFDYAFTAFVLNVVPKQTEDEILEAVESYSSQTFHVVRNRELIRYARRALARGDETVTAWWENEYAPGVTPDTEDDQAMRDFSMFGHETRRGFQRLTEPEGHTNAINLNGYSLWVKGIEHGKTCRNEQRVYKEIQNT